VANVNIHHQIYNELKVRKCDSAKYIKLERFVECYFSIEKTINFKKKRKISEIITSILVLECVFADLDPLGTILFSFSLG